MTILCSLSIGAPLWRVLASVQTWALERLIGLDASDLRWVIVALLSHSLSAAWNSLVENIAGRAWQGARFAHSMTAADTMVAAAGR